MAAPGCRHRIPARCRDFGSATGFDRAGTADHLSIRPAPECSTCAAPGTNVEWDLCSMPAAPTRALVLLVDDNAAMRQMYSLYLEHEGFGTEEAGDGFEAFDKALKRRPDVIVMDLRMPRLDGWEAVRLLKNRQATHDIPIVALTGDDELEHLKLARNAGCDAVLQKPCEPDALVAAVVKLLKSVAA
jgi:CheY-like chemotaxis protein